ncbi:MAG TPA: hypothetical protein VGO11_14680 [Chthoniobacteraceae bacterium]|nr:hypothetical protein [Chthoniobacteraceae bacterium]
MNLALHELPKRVVDLLRRVGPIHEDATGAYLFTIHVVLRDDNEVAGFLVEQRLIEGHSTPPVLAGSESKATPAPIGMQFKAPPRAARGSEPTFIFANSLESALACTRERATNNTPL